MLNGKSLHRLVLVVAAVSVLSVARGFAQAPAAPPPAPSLPPPAPLAAAFEKAASDVLQNAKTDKEKMDLLIDPLVDGNTGLQSSATRSMEAQLRQLVASKFADKFQVKAFTSENVATNPFVFIGTFTPIYATAQTIGPKDAYRICFAVLDLKSKLIVSKGFARATTDGINPVPTPAFAESPVWAQDAAVDGYIRTCQGTKAGDPINPVYQDRIAAASFISDAINAYDERQYEKALDLYKKAASMPGGDQLRVYNGLYLTNWKLNRTAEADKALDELVDYGLKGGRLNVMMLFERATTNFLPGPISQSYASWLKAIADKSLARNACIVVVGHASHTGNQDLNDRLSTLRADMVRGRLAKLSPEHGKSLFARGRGWRENIVGTGKDDATDALDRRVEFRVMKCV